MESKRQWLFQRILHLSAQLEQCTIEAQRQDLQEALVLYTQALRDLQNAPPTSAPFQ